MEWSGIWLPLSIQAGMLSSLYLLIGYYIKKRNISPSVISPITIICFTIIAALGIQHFNGFWLVHNYMGNGWIDFPVSICTSLLIIVYSERLCPTSKTARYILSYLGRNSLLILCLHIIDLDVLPIRMIVNRILIYLPISLNEILIASIVLSAKIAFVVIGTVLLRKISIIRRVF